MWLTLFRHTDSAAKKPYALIASRLFASSSYLCSSKEGINQNERNKQLRRSDEEWHQRDIAAKRAWIRRAREMKPDFDKKTLEWERERRATDPRFRLVKYLSVWLRRYAWVREELPWKSHVPLVYTSPVQHRCESCGLTRRGGRLLMWQSIAQPDLYSCHSCYMKHDLEDCMPTGYEDSRSLKAVAARKRQLDELSSKASRAESTVDGGTYQKDDRQAR